MACVKALLHGSVTEEQRILRRPYDKRPTDENCELYSQPFRQIPRFLLFFHIDIEKCSEKDQETAENK